MNFWGHLGTVCHHKRLVARYCFRAGLYRQGLTHDLSKFSPTEFWPGVRYYQGNRSPNEAERRAKGYSLAWMHHKGRNRHHLEYWTDYVDGRLQGVPMPPRYVVEMFCDRIAASRTYKKDAYTDASPYEYYMHGHDHSMIHPQTEALLLKLLTLLKEEGEDAAFAYIRRHVLAKPAKGETV